MELVVNGSSRQIREAKTVQELLNELGYGEALVAVAVNRSCVRRSNYDLHEIKAGDEIEILAPMAGG